MIKRRRRPTRGATIAGTVAVAAWLAGCSKAEPVTLATGQSLPFGIAVSGGMVYWTDLTGTVMKMSTGGGAATTLASAQSSPTGIAVGEASVVWANEGASNCPDDGGPCAPSVAGSIMSVPIGGGTPTTIASGQNGPQNVVVDAANVYWTNAGTPANIGVVPSDGAVMQAPLGGGAPIVLASAQVQVGSLAVDLTSVYWMQAGSRLNDGEVMKAPIGGGLITTLASGQYFAMGNPDFVAIAVDATSVYWLVGLNASGLAVMKVATGGGVPLQLAAVAPETQTGAFAVDQTNVYFSAGSTFFKVPVGGGGAVAFAVDLEQQVTGFGQDGADVYWISDGDGKILKTPKVP